MGKGILDDLVPSSPPEQGGILNDLVPEETSPPGFQEALGSTLLSPNPVQELLSFVATPIVKPIFDLLSRGQYVSANVIDAIGEGRWSDIPSAIWQGITGKLKGDYIDIAHEKLPKEWPSWIKTALGFIGDWVLDPMNWISIGGVTKSGNRSLLSFAGYGLGDMPGILGKFGRSIDTKVFGTLNDAVNAIRATSTGQWLAKHFSPRGPINDIELWKRYQQAQDQANFLIARAIENNIPYEKAVQDIEKTLGVPRSVIMDLVEKPVVYREVNVTQLPLPYDEMITPTLPEAPQPRPTAPSTLEVPSSPAPKVSTPKPVSAKPYEGLKPGTPEWMDVWRQHPELQEEMLEYGKNVRSITAAPETPTVQPKPAQVTSQAAPPQKLYTKPYEGLKPGSRKWNEVWKKYPQLQPEMEQYARKLGVDITPQPRTNATDVEVQPKLSTVSIEEPWVKPAPIYMTHEVQQGDTLESLARTYDTTVDRLKEINPTLKNSKSLKAGQIVQIPIMERVDRTAAYPPQVQGLVNQFREMQRVRVATEKAAGIPIESLQSDVIEYMGHYVTPEAQKALKAQGGLNWRAKFKSLLDTKIKHPSAQARLLRDLTVDEVNKLSREGAIIPGYRGPLFIEDPVLVNTVRDIMSARSIAAADFIRDVAANPEWASDAAAVKGYIGWRPLSESAQKKFGDLVKGRVFRDDIAAALDTYVQRAFNPDTVDEFVKLYDKWMSIWKTYTLGTSPSWMTNNVMGNLWNGFLLADANPAAFNDGFRLLLRGRDQTLVHTIRPGETLSGIAQQYGVTVDQLKNMNMIKDPNRIIAGAKIEIPQGTKTIGGYTDAEIFSLAQQNGLLYRGLYGSEGVKSLEQQLKGTTTAKDVLTAPVKPLFAANQFMENWARLSLFADGLKKGMNPVDAAARVKKYLFDYSQLTATEKNVFKRIVPFYAWMRFNIPLQIENLITQPGKYALIPKAVAAITKEQEGPLEPGAALPEWMQEGLYVQTGNPAPDIARFTSLRGIPPAELIQSLVELSRGEVPSVIAGANPLISAILATKGYETYSGREIPKDSLKTILPGVTIPERQAVALTELIPPLGTLSRLFSTSENPLIPNKTTGQKLLTFLTGVRQYDRSISQDTLNLINSYQTRIYDISDRYASALQSGDEAKAEAYKRLLDDIIEEFTDTLQFLNMKQGGGTK